MAEPVKVLIVDDSALVRRLLTDALSKDREIQVVGSAPDPFIARNKILELNPDVITLDIEMPKMDGLTFLKVLMQYRPMPVIVISSLTQTGSQKALEALQLGAVDVFPKPSGSYSVCDDLTSLIEKIKAAAKTKIKIKRDSAGIGVKQSVQAGETAGRNILDSGTNNSVANPGVLSVRVPSTGLVNQPQRFPDRGRRYSIKKVILIGASTGGTEAITQVLTALPKDLPGICIVQHIPAYFSAAFANRLNSMCALEVREAKSGDKVKPGLALVAPGGFHMLLKWQPDGYVVELNQGPPVHHQRPAVDVLFESAVKVGAAKDALAVIMTGMGSDGAAGMLKLHQNGAFTVAQDEASCVVFGMPKEAIKLGGVSKILNLSQIASFIDSYATSIALKLNNMV